METRTQELTELSVEMSREQLVAVNQAFVPHKKDFIRISFIESNIIFEGVDTANGIKITIGNESVRDEFVGISFFVSKFVFEKLESTMQDKVKLTFKFDGQVWHTLFAEVKGDTLQIGLPIFDEVIDNEYETEQSESIATDTLAEALKCVEASVVPMSETLACMELGKELSFGSSASLAIYNKLELNMQTKIAEDFRKYVANMCKLGSTITIENGKTATGKHIIAFRCENVEYISNRPAHQLPDMTQLVTGGIAEFKVQISELKESLERLSIPLMGADAEVVMVVEGDHLTISVYDIQHRLSTSKVGITDTAGEAHARASVNIKALLSVISVLEKEASVKYGTNSDNEVTALVFDDSKQRTYLVTNIE